MTPQLFSIEQAPASLPYWQTILDDLGRPPVRRVARVLGVSERSVYRYHQAGHAPRVVMLALFWLTRWGRSAVHTQATNDAVMAVALVRGLNDRIAQLAGQVEHLQRVGHFASANAPLVESGDRGGTPQVVSPCPSLQASGGDACMALSNPAGHVDGLSPGLAARHEELNSWPRALEPPPGSEEAGRGLDVDPGGAAGPPGATAGLRPTGEAGRRPKAAGLDLSTGHNSP